VERASSREAEQRDEAVMMCIEDVPSLPPPSASGHICSLKSAYHEEIWSSYSQKRDIQTFLTKSFENTVTSWGASTTARSPNLPATSLTSMSESSRVHRKVTMSANPIQKLCRFKDSTFGRQVALKAGHCSYDCPCRPASWISGTAASFSAIRV
jgi:hypothetical protein